MVHIFNFQQIIYSVYKVILRKIFQLTDFYFIIRANSYIKSVYWILQNFICIHWNAKYTNDISLAKVNTLNGFSSIKKLLNIYIFSISFSHSYVCMYLLNKIFLFCLQTNNFLLSMEYCNNINNFNIIIITIIVIITNQDHKRMFHCHHCHRHYDYHLISILLCHFVFYIFFPIFVNFIFEYNEFHLNFQVYYYVVSLSINVHEGVCLKNMSICLVYCTIVQHY